MKSWITEGFEAFRKGTFGNGGQNLYVSRKGILQRIFQYDLDQDGYFDLVFANCQNHLESAESYLYERNGKRVKLPGQGSLCGMTADLNGNGYQDIFVAGYYDMASPFASTDIYFGGPGGYSENNHIRIPTPWSVDCCCGDFNGSGKPSPAFAMPYYKTVRIFNQTERGLEWNGYLDLPISSGLICAADLDGDGFDELIARENGMTETTVYWGGPDGIQTGRKTVLPELPESETVPVEMEKTRQSALEKKFNAPRLLQKILWNGRQCFTLSTGKRLLFYSADSERELECVLNIEAPMALAAAAGDLDGDGFAEIAVASRMSLPGRKEGQGSYIVWNGPDGPDSRPRTILPTSNACHVDIRGKYLAVCQGASGMSFTNHALLFTAPDFEHPRLFESEDARRIILFQNGPEPEPEMLIINHYARSCVGFDRSYIYPGGPDGFSGERRVEVPSWCAVDALCADLDDDGRAELLIANNAENSLNLDPGHHLHHFGPHGIDLERSRNLKTDIGWGVVAGDFNHDGYLEIISPCNHWDDLRIFYGKDNFERYDTIPMRARNSLHWLCAVDINQNGWLDLVVPESRGNTLILWGGPEGFSPKRSQKLAVCRGINAAAADLTRNGYPDLIIGGHAEIPKNGELTPHQPHSSFVYIYWNGPEGISEFRKCMLRGDAADSFAVGDFNNDGWLDLFVGNYHGGKDRDINSFLYWNREGHFSELDRKLLFTHSASGAVAADFNEDGWLDLAVANHKVDGDHHGWSAVWWNAPKGFHDERCTRLPTDGPHGMTSTPPGNILTRGPEEFYISEPYRIEEDCQVASVDVQADIPSKTWVKTRMRDAANVSALWSSDWREPENMSCRKGSWIQYQLSIGAVNSLRSPRISGIKINFQPIQREKEEKTT